MSRFLFVGVLLVGCFQVFADQQAKQTDERPPATSLADRKSTPHRIDSKHLPNAVQIHPKVISGGLPESDAAFQELQSLGVKTIISVDGMKPDVETAAKHGLRYVHLPHGYDGIPGFRVKQLAKAVRELDGPIYIHCHHGMHRSPAAASVACVAAGMIPASESLSILKFAGTSPNYRGLYQSAREAKPLETALLDELETEFPATAEVPPLAKSMVAMEHTHDHLQLIAKAGWQSPTNHPDLDPAHETLLMKEHFTELLRSEDVETQPEEFKQYLRESELAAKAIEDALRKWQAASPPVETRETIERLSARLSANCKACHQQFRDFPLSEK
ncbi:MAG: hypothetical protein KDA57_16720 [Planctomycetales bacterium]|nr:hypothetical protein [Planctomycetales bacterium]